jgi:hypothetical protein
MTTGYDWAEYLCPFDFGLAAVTRETRLIVNHPTDELTDFEKRVVAEATRDLPEQLVAAYLEILVRKGYVKKDGSGRYKASDKKLPGHFLFQTEQLSSKW